MSNQNPILIKFSSSGRDEAQQKWVHTLTCHKKSPCLASFPGPTFHLYGLVRKLCINCDSVGVVMGVETRSHSSG
jgi:hypothetical protein